LCVLEIRRGRERERGSFCEKRNREEYYVTKLKKKMVFSFQHRKLEMVGSKGSAIIFLLFTSMLFTTSFAGLLIYINTQYF
jgi:hypothetical protein